MKVSYVNFIVSTRSHLNETKEKAMAILKRKMECKDRWNLTATSESLIK